MRLNKEPRTSKCAHWTRFVLRYILAVYLVPVGVLIGVCGLVQHYALSMAARARRRT